MSDSKTPIRDNIERNGVYVGDGIMRFQKYAGPKFDGSTYDHERDNGRLAHQMERVRKAMTNGGWHTLAQLSRVVNAPEASVSARLRDLRKPRFGNHEVIRRYVSKGLWEYRIVQPRLF